MERNRILEWRAGTPAPLLEVAWLGTIEYEAALKLQEALVVARQGDSIGDILLLLEHPHVYTLGRGASERYLMTRPSQIPIHRVSRGGEVTYHGPGQLIGYPILKLEGAARDVHAYLRALESAIIDSLADFAIRARRRQGLTGVWVGERKIASIGVGIKRWVTLHGFALNVRTDLRFFEAIVPCGITGCRMTSVRAEGRERVMVTDAARSIAANFSTVFGYRSVAAADSARLWRFIERIERVPDYQQ